ncbi:MAG: alpha/beta hydrolase [Gammaproteobacteria bacterium]|nr:alpha/beta hydrolase [Gammaproteobacteria bacterium]MDH5594377.1 alpha/beta hydrolase [Gammaproteobacteria bacterium]
MNNTKLPAVEINPVGKIKSSIIWLHGLGASGHDFEAIVPELNLPASLGLRFVFPHAPEIPVTINGGYVMPAWYDITSTEFIQEEDEAGICSSAQLLENLIASEIEQGVSEDRIILAGFSQGGAIVLHTGLRYAGRLAGIMALSTYLPLREKLEQEQSPSSMTVPVVMMHGTQDTVVPITLAEKSFHHMKKLGHEVGWYSYDMPHTVCAEQIDDIADWIRKILE